MFESVKSLCLFVFGMVESSVVVVNPCSDQSSTGGVDDLNSLLCVQRGPNSVVEPELLAYTSDVACVTNVVVGKLFAMSS